MPALPASAANDRRERGSERSRHGSAQRSRTSLGSWRGPESNRRPHGFQPCALPTELPRRGVDSLAAGNFEDLVKNRSPPRWTLLRLPRVVQLRIFVTVAAAVALAAVV